MPRLGPGCSAAHTCLRMRMRLQELDWPWGSRKAVTLSRRWITVQLAKEYRDMRSTQVSVSSWWKVSSACFSSGPELRCVAGLLGTPVMCRTRRLVVSLVKLVLRTLLLLSSFRLDRLLV